MICPDCKVRKHTKCKARNKNKQGADCDCQHRAKDVRDEVKDGVPEAGD